MNKYLQDEDFKNKLIEIRNHLHMYPEISLKEYETTKYLKEKVKDLNFEILDLDMDTGFIAFKKGGNKNSLLLRADIDGLPIEEISDKIYASKNKGVMHACGHDIHMTVLLGAAEILSKKELPGDLYLFFQPAEEINQGAKVVIEKGLFEKYNIDLVLGLHNQPLMEVGKIGIKSGGLMAAVDELKVNIMGKGGHGAIPEKTKDPIVAAAAMIMNLQTIVSRNISPLDSAVVSIGHINSGSTYNIIPTEAYFRGTIRYFEKNTRDYLRKRVYEILEGTANTYGVDVEIDYIHHLPPVYNPESMAKIGKRSAIELLGAEAVVEPNSTMGAEDFSLLMGKAKGLFFWLGIGNKEKGINNIWHHPSFDGDEESFTIGATTMAKMAIDFMNSDI